MALPRHHNHGGNDIDTFANNDCDSHDGPAVIYVKSNNRGPDHRDYLFATAAYGIYDAAGRKYNLVLEPEPVDLCSLRDDAIDAILRSHAAGNGPSDDYWELCTAANRAARAWADAASN